MDLCIHYFTSLKPLVTGVLTPTKVQLYPSAVNELQQRLLLINITFLSTAYSRSFTVRIHNTRLIPCLIDNFQEHKEEFLFEYFNGLFVS